MRDLSALAGGIIARVNADVAAGRLARDVPSEAPLGAFATGVGARGLPVVDMRPGSAEAAATGPTGFFRGLTPTARATSEIARDLAGSLEIPDARASDLAAQLVAAFGRAGGADAARMVVRLHANDMTTDAPLLTASLVFKAIDQLGGQGASSAIDAAIGAHRSGGMRTAAAEYLRDALQGATNAAARRDDDALAKQLTDGADADAWLRGLVGVDLHGRTTASGGSQT